MYIFQPIAIHCGNETKDTMGKFAELIPYKKDGGARRKFRI